VTKPLCLLGGGAGIDVFELGREKLEGIWKEIDSVSVVEPEMEESVKDEIEEVVESERREDKVDREAREELERRNKLIASEESAKKKTRKRKILM
jgi:phosphotransacetylase